MRGISFKEEPLFTEEELQERIEKLLQHDRVTISRTMTMSKGIVNRQSNPQGRIIGERLSSC